MEREAPRRAQHVRTQPGSIESACVLDTRLLRVDGGRVGLTERDERLFF